MSFWSRKDRETTGLCINYVCNEMLQLFQCHFSTALFILCGGLYGLPELVSVRDFLLSFVLEVILLCTFSAVLVISLCQKLSVLGIVLSSRSGRNVLCIHSLLFSLICPVLLLLRQFSYTQNYIFMHEIFCYSDDTVDKTKCLILENDRISFCSLFEESFTMIIFLLLSS